MIMMVTAIELVAGHEDASDDLTQLLQTETRQRYAGLHRITLLRDSVHPTRYLILSEWEGHDQLAKAMRSGLIWLHRGWTADWIAGPPMVYDEVVEIGGTPDGGGIRS